MRSNLIEYILTRRLGPPAWVEVSTGDMLPVIAGGKGDPPKPPPPSESENKALDAQTDVLREQLRLAKENEARMNQLTPFYLQQAGFTMTPGSEAGEGEQVINIGGQPYRIGQSEELKQRNNLNNEVAMASGTRALKAMKGELEVDPSVEQEITRGQQELESALIQRLGPGYKDSEPGRRALAEYDRKSKAIRYQVRHGEMTAGNAMSLATQDQLNQNRSTAQSGLYGSAAPVGVTADLLGQGAGTAATMRGQGFQDRSFAHNSNLRVWENESDAQSALIGGSISGGMAMAGSIGGAIIL